MKQSLAPSIRFRPQAHVRINSIRYHVDLLGLALLRIFAAFLPNSGLIGAVLDVYNVAAWITVLTVDPTRLPDAAATRRKQRQAWGMWLKLLPVLVLLCGCIAWTQRMPLFQNISLAVLLPAFTDELLFRHVLQPKLRQLGMSKVLAILMQSALFALAFGLSGASSGQWITAFLIGCATGWIGYRYRTFWPGYATTLLWHFAFLQA